MLQYKDGSPCATNSKREINDRDLGHQDLASRDGEPIRRKSTTISFMCERDPLAAQAAASFVAADPDNCSYFFEVRSVAACGAPEPAEQGVGPGGVFGVILLIAVGVYFVGGVIYQRNVRNARGWRQLPNYSLWAGIGSYIQVRIGRIPHVGGFLSRFIWWSKNLVERKLFTGRRPRIIGTGVEPPAIPFYNARGRTRQRSSSSWSEQALK